MKLGLGVLVLAYALSQFYRAFLAVLAPALLADIGATPDDLAFASGIWFLVFAAMQIPVGAALDSVGPKVTVVVLFTLGGAGGALAFSLAQSPLHITLAMGLIGIGCSPVLMAAYYIFARIYTPAVFATFAGAMIGLGSLGNIASSAPMAWAVTTFGWRETTLGLAVLTLIVGLMLALVMQSPERIPSAHRGSFIDLLKMPQLWPLFVMMFVGYAPAAGLRGLWVGPYAADVFGADTQVVGQVTLVMGLAMIAGNFAYGPLDRLFGTRKWVVIWGNALGVVALALLWALPDRDIWISTGLLAVVGLSGASFAVIIAHGKAFFPPHLTGRGVALMNLFGVGGVGLLQVVTGDIYSTALNRLGTSTQAYAALFAFFAGVLVIGLLIYLRSEDRTD